jgi:two-component system LytT family response regulator
MNVVIIDDDKTAIKALTKELDSYPETTIVGCATTGGKGMAIVEFKRPDLIFLDVELPDMSGINFIEKLKDDLNFKCKVVMYTSYDKYMLSAFRNKAFDYLLKPIEKSNLDTIMQRCYTEKNEEHAFVSSESSVAADSKSGNKFMLYLNTTDFVLVRTEDIGLFHYNHTRKLWEAVVAGKKNCITLKHSISSDMILSLSPKFIQVHQSFIINLEYLIEVIDNTCHFYPPFDKVDYVVVGRVFRKKLTEIFYSL